MSAERKATVRDLQAVLYNAHLILERAKLITDGAPFWMRCDENFASVVIDGDVATLSWPEIQNGYYDSSSIESQGVTFPSELLSMSLDELKAWKDDQRKRYDAEQKEKSLIETRQRIERQEAMEKQTLAALKAKYEKDDSK